MSSTCRIGLLTPSSNTIMEPRVSQILADTPGTTAHFARFRGVKIAMSDEALGQFSFVPQLEAAEHLVDAKCDVIAWGGTSGGWLGADVDDEHRAVRERAQRGEPRARFRRRLPDFSVLLRNFLNEIPKLLGDFFC